MTSFYGGPAGSSFVLKKIFRNKQEMKQDLDQRWQSPVGVGDFVFIAYGLPGDAEGVFNTNQQVDLDKYDKSYNSTLWQKIYLEDSNDQADELTGVEKFFLSVDANKNANYGLGYRLIVSMTGNTPDFEIQTDWLEPGETLVDVDIDDRKLDAPVLTFHLPKGQKIEYQEEESGKILDADQNPQVTWDESELTKPKLTIKLPRSQVIGLGTVTKVAPGENPRVELNDEDINNPVLNFELPESQVIEVVEPSAVLNADQDPRVTINDDDKAHPRLLFHLPQSQVMEQPGLKVLEPAAAPSVRDIGTVNAPKLEFSLPRGIRFEYGNQLGEKTEASYPLSSTTLEPGDYYINEITGFVYVVDSKIEDVATMVYVATLQAPLPEVDAGSKPTYEKNDSGEWVQTKPEVIESYTDPDNQKGWSLMFNIPQFPNVETDETFIGASETGSSSVAPVGESLLRFTFNIPRGSRIYAGAEVNRDNLGTAVIADAKLGDYYINTDTSNKTSCGDAYELISGASDLPAANSWELRGNIRGPIGERLSTVASYTFSNEAGSGVNQVIAEDTLEATAPVVENLYGQSLEEYQMIAVNYIYNGDATSYWYFQVDGVWDRVKLTGGMGQILKNDYVASTDTSTNSTEVVYTVDYVNKLIVANPTESEKERKTYTAKQIDDTVKRIDQDIKNSIVVWGDFTTLIPSEI